MLAANEFCFFDKPDKAMLFVLERFANILLLSLLEEANLIFFNQKLYKLSLFLIE